MIIVLFMADTKGSTAEDDDFVFISGTSPEIVKDNGDTLYQYNDAYINGEKVEGGFITSKDLRGSGDSNISDKGLYKVEERDSDDYATEVTLVVNAVDPDKAFDSYAKYAEKGILRLNSADGDLTDANKTSFSYDDDTTFVVVELKKDNTDVDSVYVGGVSDIETDAEGLTGVFVVTVEDDGDDTPMPRSFWSSCPTRTP